MKWFYLANEIKFSPRLSKKSQRKYEQFPREKTAVPNTRNDVEFDQATISVPAREHIHILPSVIAMFEKTRASLRDTCDDHEKPSKFSYCLM